MRTRWRLCYRLVVVGVALAVVAAAPAAFAAEHTGDAQRDKVAWEAADSPVPTSHPSPGAPLSAHLERSPC